MYDICEDVEARYLKKKTFSTNFSQNSRLLTSKKAVNYTLNPFDQHPPHTKVDLFRSMSTKSWIFGMLKSPLCMTFATFSLLLDDLD